MSPGATFERVYRALREQLSSGRYAAGTHLEPAALSDDLNASVTPVRDALHRLVGEGLVEAPRGDGFRTPLVTELGLRHLYRWNAALLDLAARARSPAATVPRAPAPAGDIAGTEHLFLAIADRSGNPEHVGSVAALNQRLRHVRRIETNLLATAEEEIRVMVDLLAANETAGLRRSIAAYHRRRERLAPDVVVALHRPS